MVHVETWRARLRDRKEIDQKVRQALRQTGYTLPIEEAKRRFFESLGLPKADPAEGAAHNREWLLLRGISLTTPGQPAGITLAPLKSVRGFLIISLLAEEGIVSGPSCLRVTVVSDSPCDEECATVRTALAGLALQEPGASVWTEESMSGTASLKAAPAFTLPDHGDLDLRSADLLGDAALRQFLQAARALGSDSRQELERKLPEAGDLLNRCLELGLITSELVIICRQTADQLNRVPGPDVIEMMARRGVRCSRCGRSVKDELIHEVLTVSPRAWELLDPSRTTAGRMVRHLQRRGVRPGDIQVRPDETPTQSGTYFSFGGRVTVGIIDGPFTLQHAHAFGAQAGASGSSLGVIWARDGVPTDVRAFLERAQPTLSIRYVDSTERLPAVLDEILERLRWELVETAIQPLASLNLVLANIPAGVLDRVRSYAGTPEAQRTPEAGKAPLTGLAQTAAAGLTPGGIQAAATGLLTGLAQTAAAGLLTGLAQPAASNPAPGAAQPAAPSGQGTVVARSGAFPASAGGLFVGLGAAAAGAAVVASAVAETAAEVRDALEGSDSESQGAPDQETP